MLEEFPWVENNEESGGMMCRWCMAFPALAGPHTSFVTEGECHTIKHPALKQHDESDGHKAVTKAKEETERSKIGQFTGDKTLQSLHKFKQTQLQNLFSIAHEIGH